MTPCVVITRDRVSHLRLCIASLERRCAEIEIHIVDHGSTWPPMLDYLDSSPHPVHRVDTRPPHALWNWPRLAAIVGNARYIVTDPDVVIDAPDDWLDHLWLELDAGGIVKAGLGLRLDDLPDVPLSADIRAWEAAFWHTRHSPNAWAAPVDTTLALYPPLPTQPAFALGPAARLDAPYLLRHLPWYDDPDPAETQHYRERMCPGSSHWTNGGW